MGHARSASEGLEKLAGSSPPSGEVQGLEVRTQDSPRVSFEPTLDHRRVDRSEVGREGQVAVVEAIETGVTTG